MVKSLALVVAALFQAAAPSAPQAFDLNSKLINTPDSNWTAYGPDQTSKRLPTGGPKNYPALQVTVAKPGRNAWDDGALYAIPKPIGAGDVIVVAVYLRDPDLADGQTETLPLIGAIGAAAPYPAIASAPATISNQWKVYFAHGTAPLALPANGASATVHLASARHTVQLGPIKIYDLGPGFDVRRLPH